MHQRYQKQGLAVLAIDMGESASKVEAFVAEHGVSFPHFLDPDYKIASMFSVRATPTNFLVNRQGHVIGGGAGYRDWSRPEAHALIQSLLNVHPTKATNP